MKVVSLDKVRGQANKTKAKDLSRMLRDTMAEIKNGEVSGLVLLVERPDGGYTERHSGGMDMAKRIGLLDLMKNGLILDVISRQD